MMEAYTVERIMEGCACNLQCKECNACIHTYRCNCPDHATLFNMCKHIHVICTKYPAVSNADSRDHADEDHELHIAEAGPHEVSRNAEAAAHIAELSRPSCSIDRMRETARMLNAQVAGFITSIDSVVQMQCIIDSLKAIAPKL